MRPRSPWFFGVLALAALAAIAGGRVVSAEDSLEEVVRARVVQLGHEDAAVRDRAQADLLQMGSYALPTLEWQRVESTDPEVLSRIDFLVDRIDELRWETDLKSALAEARREGKPLLVVHADGPIATAYTAGGAALRTATLGDVEVRATLRRTFVLCWLDGSEGRREGRVPVAAAEPPREGAFASALHFYFCAPSGEVRHFLAGWWSAGRFRREAERAAELVAIPDLRLAGERRTEMVGEVMTELIEALEEKRRGTAPGEGRSDTIRPFIALRESYRRGDDMAGRAVAAVLGELVLDGE